MSKENITNGETDVEVMYAKSQSKFSFQVQNPLTAVKSILSKGLGRSKKRKIMEQYVIEDSEKQLEGGDENGQYQNQNNNNGQSYPQNNNNMLQYQNQNNNNRQSQNQNNNNGQYQNQNDNNGKYKSMNNSLQEMSNSMHQMAPLPSVTAGSNQVQAMFYGKSQPNEQNEQNFGNQPNKLVVEDERTLQTRCCMICCYFFYEEPCIAPGDSRDNCLLCFCPAYRRMYQLKNLELSVLGSDKFCQVNECGKPAVMVCGDKMKHRYAFPFCCYTTPMCERMCCEDHIQVWYKVRLELNEHGVRFWDRRDITNYKIAPEFYTCKEDRKCFAYLQSPCADSYESNCPCVQWCCFALRGRKMKQSKEEIKLKSKSKF